jgi:ectoine hydroxylase-related dioxygenase (phytanoyl-CoA dioxygenase family)
MDGSHAPPLPDDDPLWTDGPGALSHLQGLSARRALRRGEKADLKHLIEHGWLIKRGAIEPELVDAFVKDIRSVHRKPGKFVSTDHRNGNPKLKLTGPEPDRFESLFDLYVNFVSSRRVCLHPAIMRLLELVFEARPVAFQQLLFQRSNGHQTHQDTAFVAVEKPLFLVATWIALQDVVEGSGELSFYDKSHKLPPFRFSDGSRRFNPAKDDMGKYAAHLDRECATAGLEYQRFMARKGDVFFWTADLVHRSHPRSLPDDTPRLSCVTHYCPETVDPFWFRFHPNHRGFEAYDGGRALIASSFYRMPNRGKTVAPDNNYG